MHRWQKDLWAGLTGNDPKNMKIILNRRNIGKSVMSQMWNIVDNLPAFSIVGKLKIDEDCWFTVKCNDEKVSEWIKTQPQNMWKWKEHVDQYWSIHNNIFDVHEKIHTMLQLKYSDGRV
jgi:hypothetical protein